MTPDVAVASVALAATLICSIPHIARLAKSSCQPSSSHAHQAWYEDIDGKSTPEAVADFGRSLHRSKWATFLVAAAGSGLAATLPGRAWMGGSAAADDGPAARVEDVVSLAAWLVVMVVQVPAMWASWSETYRLGTWACVSGLFIAAVPIMQLASYSYVFVDGVAFYLKLAQLLAVLCLLGCCVTIRRRPHLVDAKGRSINWQYSDTAIGRFSYSFMSAIVATAKKNQDFGVNMFRLTTP